MIIVQQTYMEIPHFVRNEKGICLERRKGGDFVSALPPQVPIVALSFRTQQSGVRNLSFEKEMNK
jgi:hypothetical protein